MGLVPMKGISVDKRFRITQNGVPGFLTRTSRKRWRTYLQDMNVLNDNNNTWTRDKLAKTKERDENFDVTWGDGLDDITWQTGEGLGGSTGNENDLAEGRLDDHCLLGGFNHNKKNKETQGDDASDDTNGDRAKGSRYGGNGSTKRVPSYGSRRGFKGGGGLGGAGSGTSMQGDPLDGRNPWIGNINLAQNRVDMSRDDVHGKRGTSKTWDAGERLEELEPGMETFRVDALDRSMALDLYEGDTIEVMPKMGYGQRRVLEIGTVTYGREVLINERTRGCRPLKRDGGEPRESKSYRRRSNARFTAYVTAKVTAIDE